MLAGGVREHGCALRRAGFRRVGGGWQGEPVSLTSEPFVTADDHAVAADLARTAGELLLRVRVSGITGGSLKDLGDRSSHDYLVEALARLRPDDGLLSEEGADDLKRLAAQRVWIIDPVDGTREFSEPPRVDWAVHVALTVDGEAVVGAVALPARGLVLATGQPLPVRADPPARPRVLVSRTRPTAMVDAISSGLNGELLPMGSAGAKAMAVVLGEAEVYAHAGGQYEWDSAAPAAVAQAAGLHVSRLDGSPLRYNRRDPWLPDLLICRPELADEVLAIVSAYL
jgi:3'(2'), 5'-bisphosphate nucleotidase